MATALMGRLLEILRADAVKASPGDITISAPVLVALIDGDHLTDKVIRKDDVHSRVREIADRMAEDPSLPDDWPHTAACQVVPGCPLCELLDMTAPAGDPR